ncbi:hypothetical protein SM007_37115 [Streptomyces avermitilis]|uniref:Uncharacterized protein n=1 Tax=Streptomyces avermitilis TaxID=33903 RepID=A0A4D4MGX6_STRAX|nr:hypothetical protein SM007_37115 [Streptomyces avermitilis]GDY68509.1 hypothetical protein SAV14893_079020 [Streptomyces avermitilis]GDY71116.1 hypothetical protein SAV31267_006010 [Streptomyces avermitilis]
MFCGVAAADDLDVSAWLLDVQNGPDRGVLHAPDCDEASKDASMLKLEPALDAAEKVGVRPRPDR